MIQVVNYLMLKFDDKFGHDVIQLYDIEQNGDKQMQIFEVITITEIL
jgi:hypothetical protein